MSSGGNKILFGKSGSITNCTVIIPKEWPIKRSNPTRNEGDMRELVSDSKMCPNQEIFRRAFGSDISCNEESLSPEPSSKEPNIDGPNIVSGRLYIRVWFVSVHVIVSIYRLLVPWFIFYSINNLILLSFSPSRPAWIYPAVYLIDRMRMSRTRLLSLAQSRTGFSLSCR